MYNSNNIDKYFMHRLFLKQNQNRLYEIENQDSDLYDSTLPVISHIFQVHYTAMLPKKCLVEYRLYSEYSTHGHDLFMNPAMSLDNLFTVNAISPRGGGGGGGDLEVWKRTHFDGHV